MQTTTKRQIEVLTKLVSDLKGTVFNKPTAEEFQAMHDTIDTFLALRGINFEEIKLEFQNNHGPVGGGEDAKKYLRIIATLDLLIETFRG